MQIGWLNPRIDSHNLGDQIIEDAVRQELSEIVGDGAQLVPLPTQRLLTLTERRQAADCDFFVVGGTNLLNGNIPRYIQWKLDPWLFKTYAGRVILLGVGWWQYQSVNKVSSLIWANLLRGHLHSARDEYTAERLRGLGLRAVNTGCPTMWRLPDEVAFGGRRRRVIATVTDYHRAAERDTRMLRLLAEQYDEVLVWLQGAKDRRYLSSIGASAQLVDPSLAAFDEVLREGDVDYFGTRLHAGVRALQYGVRSTIVAIDNRATEIARDTGLPVVGNDFTGAQVEASATRNSVELSLARDDIDLWRRNVRSVLVPA